MGIVSLTEFGGDAGGTGKTGGLGLYRVSIAGVWIVIGKAGKRESKRPIFHLRIHLWLASIRDDAGTDWICMEWHQDVSSRSGGPVADGSA